MSYQPLWEVDHPYYCSESNFYKRREPEQTFASWADFVTSMLYYGDRDLNLLFRWDWIVPDPADYGYGEPVPGERLELYFMLQRKGVFLPVTVEAVTREEEPAIRSWLESCWQQVLALWAPVAAVQEATDG